MKKIAILGSTGSIGVTLINLIKKDRNKIKIVLLTANKNYKRIINQTKIFKVKNIIITDKKSYLIAKEILKNKTINVFNDFDSLNKIFKNKRIDYIMSAISGFDGLNPTLDIIKFTKTIAIANKESIICGWSLIQKKLNKFNTKFIPVDSEHFSIWSLMNNLKNSNIEKVFITASGGPFKDLPLKDFKSITPAQALNHPSWSMGKKISIDSATMMNKVFEIIEAKKIFNLKYSQLGVLVHSQSYVHAIVKFTNGLIKVLVHETNMKIPIFNSLYPHSEKKIKTKKIDFDVLNNLDFHKTDFKRFPIMKLIKKLPNRDSLFETVIVSANDCLVENFLNKKIKFLDISKFLFKITNSKKYQKYMLKKPTNINQIKSLNEYVRLKTNNLCV